MDAANTFSKDIRIPGIGARRIVFFTLATFVSYFGIKLMYGILSANGLGLLELVLLILFSLTFMWIAVAFCTALSGFVLMLMKRDPLTLAKRLACAGSGAPIMTRTAILMPVYNEDPKRVFAGLEATYLDLAETGMNAAYDFYLLSDTNEPKIARDEEKQFYSLRSRIDAETRLFYRRRAHNEERKAGNIADFCRRWGTHYDYMVILDADSLMTGKSLLTLTRAMQENPKAGIIQTVPMPTCQKTLFGRFLQFSATVYSPVLATGLAFWQMDAANYWGHNAIIRVRAFMESCGLPVLAGKPPLGGQILSHDFVEAALIRRSGWHVYLLSDLQGSYEEVPSNVLDYLKRDRRWAEGNLQHLKLLGAHGLHLLSRVHFSMGAFAYASSLLWFLMLVAGTFDALGRALFKKDYFDSAHQLFPDWHIAKTDEILFLFLIVGALLILPKIMGLCLHIIGQKQNKFGGTVRLLLSAFGELIFSIVIAPIMMIYHAYFVASVLIGRKVTWGPQPRAGRSVSWPEAFRASYIPTLIGVAWIMATVTISPVFFYSLSPVLFGLLFAAPLIALSSSASLGKRLRDKRGFLVPSEISQPRVLRYLQRGLSASTCRPSIVDEGSFASSSCIAPPERRGVMPIQKLDSGPRWSDTDRTWKQHDFSVAEESAHE